MIIARDIPPACSPDLELSAEEQDGQKVIKHCRRGTYLRVGPHESFLLEQLDGQQTYESIAARFRKRFADDISLEEIGTFVSLARQEGLLEKRRAGRAKSRPSQAGAGQTLRRMVRAARAQSLLYFRVKLVNPDRLLSWLEPRTRFLFSTPLALLAMVGGLAALVATWVNRGELLETVSSQFGLRAIALYWVTTILVTILHEFGHGLACKKYGGEVREMGALWIFFTPCLYCNVSDAWMFAGRWRRLLVSLAGTYVDLLVWMVSVALWRFAVPDSALHSLAWVLVTGCGVRLAFNLNPLLRLDGYYALADFLQQPNLRLRARERMMVHVRWLFWGGPRPQPEKDHWLLLGYGVLSWVFSVGLLGLLSFQLSAWLGQFMGVAGVVAAGGFFVLVTRSLNHGLLGGDFWTMLTKRWLRLVLFGGLLGGAMFLPVPDQAGGVFVIKPHVRWEVCAPVPGFLRAVHTAEGQTVEANSLVATIEIPELANQISRKQAEIAEVNAELRRLTTGARAEEIAEQRARIERSKAWRDLGRTSLEKAEAAFQQELETLDFRIEQARAELDYRAATRGQAEQLHARGGLAEQQLMAQKRLELEATAELRVAESQRKTREAEGVMSSQTELARREKELADEEARLTLLLAGSRTEDIEAEQARLRRLEEEMRILREHESLQQIGCPVAGTAVTPRLRDQIGQYFDRGKAILVVEGLDQLEADVAVPEQQAQALAVGQPVRLKPRLWPHHTLDGTVLRISPAVNALTPGAASQVTVHCTVDDPDGLLRSGMTGYGRVSLGKMRLGQWIYFRSMRLLRTEFWW